MKSSAAAVAIALAGFAAAQTSLPTCAQSCVNQFTSGNAIAGCSNLDVKCICSNENFLSGIACCLAGACPEADQQTAVKYAQNICTGAGVTVPDQVVCKTANASASGSQTGTATQTGTAQTGTAQSTSPASATNTANAAATMGPVALLGGLVAALVAL